MQQLSDDNPNTQPADGPLPSLGQETRNSGTTLVKIGGSTLGSHDTTLQDLVTLQQTGKPAIVVHGGGKVITEWMEKQGVRPRFVRGLRVTDKPSLDIVVSVVTGLIIKQIVTALTSIGGKAIGLSGADGEMLKGTILKPELGYVGNVSEVNISAIISTIESGFIPVIAPVALNTTNSETTFLNVNADTAAGEIAAAMQAERLVFMTDVEGVLDSSKRLIPRVTERLANRLMTSNVIAGGMLPKIGACMNNIGPGRSTHIVDGRVPHVLQQILEGNQIGTRVG